MFGQETIIELARYRPTTVDGLSTIVGLGARRIQRFGSEIRRFVKQRAAELGLSVNEAPPAAVGEADVSVQPGACGAWHAAYASTCTHSRGYCAVQVCAIHSGDHPSQARSVRGHACCGVCEAASVLSCGLPCVVGAVSINSWWRSNPWKPSLQIVA